MKNEIKLLENAYLTLTERDKVDGSNTLPMTLQLNRMKDFVSSVSKVDIASLAFSHAIRNSKKRIAEILGYYVLAKSILDSLPTEESQEFPIDEQCDIEFDYKGKLWNSVPIDEMYQHFEVMTKRLNKKDEPFLTKEQLEYFFEHVFVNNSVVPKKIKINYGKGEKGFVIKRFYQFYYDVYPYTSERSKHRYIKLVCDNFQGMEYAKVKNLFYGNVCKMKWS